MDYTFRRSQVQPLEGLFEVHVQLENVLELLQIVILHPAVRHHFFQDVVEVALY